jgi:hypothetical protein
VVEDVEGVALVIAALSAWEYVVMALVVPYVRVVVVVVVL